MPDTVRAAAFLFTRRLNFYTRNIFGDIWMAEVHACMAAFISFSRKPRTSNLEPRTSNLEPRTSNLRVVHLQHNLSHENENPMRVVCPEPFSILDGIKTGPVYNLILKIK